jgi:phenylacetate-CoA ligase
MPRKVAGSVYVARRLRGQRSVHFLPRDVLLQRRDARVREIVAYAAAHVPHYRDVFRREGIDSREIRTARDLARLPLVGKEELRSSPERFLSERLPAGPTLELSTTGTTGVPVAVVHDAPSLLENMAHGERERMVEATLAGGGRYSILEITRSGSTSRRIREWYDANTIRPARLPYRMVPISKPLEGIVEEIERWRPDVIWSYAAFLETFFRLLLGRPRPRHLPKVAVYGSGGMSAAGRTLVEEEFGVAVIAAYNAVEALKLAFVCEERRGFHIHEDLAAVRLVDRSGRPVATGATGEVVISNLVNRGTVLLNYRLGDQATLTTEPCGCGRTSRVLTSVDGRIDEIIVLPSGELVLTVQVWDALAPYRFISRWQLLQRTTHSFELHVVVSDRGALERDRDSLLASLAERLPGVETEIVEVHEIPLNRGKFRPIIPLSG